MSESNPIAHEETRQFAVQVVQRLRGAGHEAVWAGGCVRDLLLGKTPKDYDVATSACPEQVCGLFRRTVEVGMSFGVVRVLGPKGIQVEVATFRNDGHYTDGRRPDHVTFSTAKEDAQRRDFTINGMFFDPISEEVHDYVGGQEDLRRACLRAIGNAHDRFTEDKLRMLRAVRFAARMNFRIDPDTEAALRNMAHQLPVVSEERILSELRLMLTAPTRATAMRLLRQVGLLPVVLPEIAGTLQVEQHWQTTLTLLHFWSGEITLGLAFAILVTTRGHKQARHDVEGLFLRLKGTNEDRDHAVWLVENRHALDHAPTARLCTLKRLLARPGANDLLDYHEALAGAGLMDAKESEHLAASNRFTRHLRARYTDEQWNPPPLVTGHDLIEAGLKPGPRFKQILDLLRDEQLDEQLSSRASALDRLHQLLRA